MYAWIWRKLPYGLPGKLVGSVLLVSVAVSLLWYVVFPWAEPLLPFDDVQVESGEPGAPEPDPAGGDPEFQMDEPAGDEHDLPYDIEQNNTPPPSPSR